jgi:hypothetical protein
MNISISVPQENEWARGCPQCKYGIVSAPERTGACELHLERLVQAIDGDITFCECRAGKANRANLLNRYEFLKREAKRDPRMATFAERKTHPDIEAARKAMQGGYEYVKAPPIRWVGDEPVAPPEPIVEQEPA